MAKTSVKPNHTQKIEIGLESRRNDPRLIFEVRADIPITTYLVDDMGLEDFRAGATPNYYAGFKDRRSHQADLTLPNFRRYYLIMRNDSPERTAKIEYDIRRVR